MTDANVDGARVVAVCTTFFAAWRDWMADMMNQNAQVYIGTEQTGDSAEIGAVVEAAFWSSPLGHHGEADLVEFLRNSSPDIVSLVAKHEDHMVGHVLFSPVRIEGDDSLCGMGLGRWRFRRPFSAEGSARC